MVDPWTPRAPLPQGSDWLELSLLHFLQLLSLCTCCFSQHTGHPPPQSLYRQQVLGDRPMEWFPRRQWAGKWLDDFFVFIFILILLQVGSFKHWMFLASTVQMLSLKYSRIGLDSLARCNIYSIVLHVWLWPFVFHSSAAVLELTDGVEGVFWQLYALHSMERDDSAGGEYLYHFATTLFLHSTADANLRWWGVDLDAPYPAVATSPDVCVCVCLCVICQQCRLPDPCKAELGKLWWNWQQYWLLWWILNFLLQFIGRDADKCASVNWLPRSPSSCLALPTVCDLLSCDYQVISREYPTVFRVIHCRYCTVGGDMEEQNFSLWTELTLIIYFTLAIKF